MQANKRFAAATGIVVAIIIYGSLYPFAFERPVDGIEGALRTLWASRAAMPSRAAFIANLLLYMPFGFCAASAFRRRSGNAARVVLITVIGALLSISMEVAQFFDQGRVTDAPDVYANTIGTMLGVVGSRLLGPNFRWPLLAGIVAARIPVLLLAAWIGYRLFPFVPAIDLHKYWHAIAPVILHPALTAFDLFRYTAIWLAISALVEAIVGPAWVRLAFPLFAVTVVVGEVMVVGTVLNLGDAVGALSAMAWRGLLAFSPSVRITLVAIAFFGAVVVERLEPFRFGMIAGPFGWVPFWSFMSGDLGIDTMAFLQKLFLYGTAIWLLVSVGLRLGSASVLIAAMLFATSQAERFLPGRSAEVTDAVMALIIGCVFALIRPKPDRIGNRLGRD